MRENQTIESSIAIVLTHSHLPMDRRAEVAEELRDHLSQLVDAKCAEGMSKDCAVKAALADFGSLDVIRRQLRKQQGVLDRRQVLTALRRYVWPMIMVSGALATMVAVLAPNHASVSLRCLFGVCIFLGICGIMLAYGVGAELLVIGLQRSRPRLEYRFRNSFCYWGAVVAAFFFVIISMAPLALIVFGYFGQWAIVRSSLSLSPQLQADAHWFLLHSLVAGAVDTPIRSFLLPILTVISGALWIALYERSRCVDKDYVPGASMAE